jgi:plasmid stabilization system protein ParE
LQGRSAPLIAFTPEARRQVRELRNHYEKRDRPEAVRGLRTALATAWGKIVAQPAAGLATPRPYPNLAQPGRAWIKAGRYWIAYSANPGPVIVGVFYETANIPDRL